MDTFEAIRQRRSVKYFDPAYVISEDEIQKILSHAVLSPTSFNIQNWRFVLVRDKKTREAIRSASWDQPQMTDASLLIILCANLKSWQDSHKYWVQAPENIQKMMSQTIEQIYRSDKTIQRDEAMRSCGIAAQTIMLTATAMGYESCPMVGFDFKKVAKLIKLPKGYIICMVVAVGKAVKAAYPRPGQLPLKEIIVENHF